MMMLCACCPRTLFCFVYFGAAVDFLTLFRVYTRLCIFRRFVQVLQNCECVCHIFLCAVSHASAYVVSCWMQPC